MTRNGMHSNGAKNEHGGARTIADPNTSARLSAFSTVSQMPDYWGVPPPFADGAGTGEVETITSSSQALAAGLVAAELKLVM